MNESRKMAEKLNDLLQRSMDAEKHFRQAAEDVRNGKLREFLMDRALQRYDFRQELRSEIRNFGEDIKDESSTGGDLRRTWADLKTALSSNKEEAVLEEIVKGEKKTVAEYNEVIKEHDFPPSTENLLIKQRNAIERTLSLIRRKFLL